MKIDEDKTENTIIFPDERVYTGQINKERFVPEGKGRVKFPNGN